MPTPTMPGFFPAQANYVASPSIVSLSTASEPPVKKIKPNPSLPSIVSQVPAEIGKSLSHLIEKDAALFRTVGWKEFVRRKRPRDDFGELFDLPHPARRLLRQYKYHGAPVVLHDAPWTSQQLDAAVQRGPHQSCFQYIDFLEEEFISMLGKQQWVLLPYEAVKHLRNLRLSPPGVVPQRERRPRWICDYTWSGVNPATAPIAPKEAMQFGHALDRILRQILHANPKHGHVYLLKLDISDGFYRIALAPHDIPKLGVIFPTRPGVNPIVALPLVLPMGWANSPPIFSAATETIADIVNQRLQSPFPSQRHHLDDLAATVQFEPPQTLRSSSNPSVPALLQNPVSNPYLSTFEDPVQSTEVYVDDFVEAVQGDESQQHRARQILLHTVDEVFRPLSSSDHPQRAEPVSMKKLLKGDCSWDTVKLILGWVIDTVNKTIHLPQHRIDRLFEILDSIPPSQKRTSVKKWHKILGELRSMSLALPGSRNIFSLMQHALSQKQKGRLTLSKGVHQTLRDFRWMANDISTRPTRIAEIIPTHPSLLGDHDASKAGAGGVWFPAEQSNTRHDGTPLQPIVWRYEWPADIQQLLVSSDNPQGTITNSDLELAGGFLHLEAAVQNFDVRERTILSRTDNLPSLFWQRKGSTSLSTAPAHLLRLFGIHQRYHRYVSRHDYLPGKSNLLADHSSRLFDLSDDAFLTTISSLLPQKPSFKLWTPSQQITSAVTSALRKKMLKPESVLVEPPPVTHIGEFGQSLLPAWASIPYSKPSRIRYPSFKSSAADFIPEHYQPAAIPFALDRLKTTYGQLDKRSSCWVNSTHA